MADLQPPSLSAPPLSSSCRSQRRASGSAACSGGTRWRCSGSSRAHARQPWFISLAKIRSAVAAMVSSAAGIDRVLLSEAEVAAELCRPVRPLNPRVMARQERVGEPNRPTEPALPPLRRGAGSAACRRRRWCRGMNLLSGAAAVRVLGALGSPARVGCRCCLHGSDLPASLTAASLARRPSSLAPWAPLRVADLGPVCGQLAAPRVRLGAASWCPAPMVLMASGDEVVMAGADVMVPVVLALAFFFGMVENIG